MGISALIIAKNEENKIRKCLESLTFADEIVIVLDRTSDNTEEIVKKFTKKIYRGNWEFEGDRRNFGINKCKNNWILEVDADEIIPLKLAKEIKKNVNADTYDFFYIKLLNYINNIPVKYGWMACMAPDGKFCLFRKNNKFWKNQRVHPDYILEGKKGDQLKNSIEHKMSENISDLILRFNRNTSLFAEDLLSQKRNISKYFSIRKIFSRFFKCYFSRKGFREKEIGLIISILSSLYPIVSAIKSKFLEENS
tara:strand:+ start:544 stop:1299 length:756 start_codon:yes stop_codon:yes gene_type:complete